MTDEPSYLSPHAANACMYVTYCFFLVMGLFVAWYYRKNGEFLAGNHTRTGFYLALNFIASGMGCGVLVTYPQIGAFSGLHGLLTYCAAGAVPFFMFAALGPIIRKHCPRGFVLTEWVRVRYGITAGLILCACTILTIYLFAVSELAALQAAVTTLTNLDGLPPLLVEALFVATYTSFGGFFTSFFTDNIQAVMFIVLLIISMISIGVNIDYDKALVGPSGLLKSSKLGWKLLYILMVAIITNDCFMAGFWIRTFAARTTKDLWIGCSVAAVVLFFFCAATGITGMFAVWSGLLDPKSDTFYDDSTNAFYLILLQLPRWVQGFVLVFIVSLSCCTFDSLISALTSTVSNDIFRNRVRLIYMRVFTFALMAPVIIVALRAPNVLTIYLIVDLLAAAVVPVLFLGLSRKFYFLSGWEIITGLVGGIITTFVFGTVYYHSAADGANLLLLNTTDGLSLYSDGWAPFGAFVAAPIGSFIGLIVGFVIRFAFLAFKHKRWNAVFDRDQEHWDAWFYRLITPKSDPWYEGKHPIFEKIDWLLFIPASDVDVNMPHDSDSISLGKNKERDAEEQVTE